MTFARHQFELAAPQDDGQPLFAHYQAYENATGNVHPRLLDAPQIPDGCGVVWTRFLELHGCRTSNGFGLNRITFADMKAWQDVRRTQLQPWEIDLIRKADDLWLSEFAPKPKAGK